MDSKGKISTKVKLKLWLFNKLETKSVKNNCNFTNFFRAENLWNIVKISQSVQPVGEQSEGIRVYTVVYFSLPDYRFFTLVYICIYNISQIVCQEKFVISHTLCLKSLQPRLLILLPWLSLYVVSFPTEKGNTKKRTLWG